MSVRADDTLGLYIRGLTTPRASEGDPVEPIVYTTRPLTAAQRTSLAALLDGASESDLVIRPCMDGAPATLAQQIRFLDPWGTEAGLTVSLATSRDALEVMHAPREALDDGGLVRLTAFLSATDTTAVLSSAALGPGDVVWIGDECVEIDSTAGTEIIGKGRPYSVLRGRIGTRAVAHQATDPPLLRLGLTDTMGAPAWLLRWDGDAVEIVYSGVVTGVGAQGAALSVSLSSQLATIVDQTIRTPALELADEEIEDLALVYAPSRQSGVRSSPLIDVEGPSGLFVVGLPQVILSVDQHGRGEYQHAWVRAGGWDLLVRVQFGAIAYRDIGSTLRQEIRPGKPVGTRLRIERSDGSLSLVTTGLVRVLAVARDGAVLDGIDPDGSIPPEVLSELGPLTDEDRSDVREALAPITETDPLGAISRALYQSDAFATRLREPTVEATWRYGIREIFPDFPGVAQALLQADDDQSPDEALSVEDVDSADFFEPRAVVRGIDVDTNGDLIALRPVVTPPYAERARRLIEQESLRPGFAFAAPTRAGGVRVVSWHAAPLDGATPIGRMDFATTTEVTALERDSAVLAVTWSGPRRTIAITSVPGRDRYRAGRSLEIETGWSVPEPSEAAVSVLTRYQSAARTLQCTLRGTVTLDVGQLVSVSTPTVPSVDGTRGIVDVIGVVLQVAVELASRAQIARVLLLDSARLRGWAPSAMLDDASQAGRITLSGEQPQWGPTSWIRPGIRVQVLDADTGEPGTVLTVSSVTGGDVITSPAHTSGEGEVLVLAGQDEQPGDAIERIRYAYLDGAGISPAQWQ